jgi:hypothetical protein
VLICDAQAEVLVRAWGHELETGVGEGDGTTFGKGEDDLFEGGGGEGEGCGHPSAKMPVRAKYGVKASKLDKVDDARQHDRNTAAILK